MSSSPRCPRDTTPFWEKPDRGSPAESGRDWQLRAHCLKDAPIVILDEATAYSDPENEVALQDAIDRLAAGRTVIIIAHRLSTVAGADQILVIDQGRISRAWQASGLLDSGGLYAQMWEAFSSASSIALTGRQTAEAALSEGGTAS